MATNEQDITAVARVQNPFAVSQSDRLNIGAVTVEMSRAVAQVKGMIESAQDYPRNKHDALEKIIETCSRLDFAQEALYAFPRGNEKVEGLTIRAAEMIATAWGNIEFGIQELSQADGESEMLAFAWDLETNTRSSQSFRFKHERHTRQGVSKLTDPRDIYETGANLGARRLRARILAIIDPDVRKVAEMQCRATITASVSGGNKKTLAEKTDLLVKEFYKLGIKASHIEQKLGHPIKGILPEEYTDLATIYKSLKDGYSNPSDWFAVAKAAGSSEKAQEVEKLLAGNGKAAEPTEPTPEEQEAIRQREQAESGELL